MKITRRYTVAGQDPFAAFTFVPRTSRIVNPNGSVVFEMNDVQVPEGWPQVAVDVLAQIVELVQHARIDLAGLVVVVVAQQVIDRLERVGLVAPVDEVVDVQLLAGVDAVERKLAARRRVGTERERPRRGEFVRQRDRRFTLDVLGACRRDHPTTRVVTT